MGQQQLLLVILVTIIVGIATVVAINTFGSAADSANLDAVRQDVASIAASAQGYYMKPEMLGGGGQNFNNVTFDNITFPKTGQNSTASSFEVVAHPASAYSSYDGSDPNTEPGAAPGDDQLTATITEDGMSWSS